MLSREEASEKQHEFLDWISKFGIYRALSDADYEQARAMDEKSVWTELWDDDYAMVTKGFYEPDPEARLPVTGYYVAKRPWSEDDEDLPFSSVTVACENCEGAGVDQDGEECLTCEGSGEDSDGVREFDALVDWLE